MKQQIKNEITAACHALHDGQHAAASGLLLSALTKLNGLVHESLDGIHDLAAAHPSNTSHPSHPSYKTCETNCRTAPKLASATSLLCKVMAWEDENISDEVTMPPELHNAITRFLNGAPAPAAPSPSALSPQPSALPQMSSVLAAILEWDSGLPSSLRMRDTLRQDAEQLLADHEQLQVAGSKLQVPSGTPEGPSVPRSDAPSLTATLVEAGSDAEGQPRLIFHATQQDIAALPILPLYKKCRLTITPPSVTL